jgi:gluconolactonase
MVAETVTRRILRFELDKGGRRLGEPEIFFQFDRNRSDGPDGPDGIAFDAEGNLLVAMCGAGAVAVLSPHGAHLGSVPAGGRNCTNCVFGGEDFQTLYVTEDEQRALLATRWPVPGQRRYSRSLSRA